MPAIAASRHALPSARMSQRWWLQVHGGKRLRIGAAGVLIGRSAQCDVVLVDATASRSQAIVYAGPGGPRVTVLGQGATTINDQPVASEGALGHGDVLGVPGLSIGIAADQPSAVSAAPQATSWVIESSTSGHFGIARARFVVGGAADDDLRIAGWPPHALCFHASEQLEVETSVPAAIDGVATEAGDRAGVDAGSVIELAGERLTVIAGGLLGEQSTQTGGLAGDPPTYVRMEFLPRGGRLTLRQRGGERGLYLADRRCDLVATLLRPPDGHAPGDYIADDVLIPRIWPNRAMARSDLNVLIHRTRRDFARADLDGARLLPRIAGGSATRFTLAPGARVELA